MIIKMKKYIYAPLVFLIIGCSHPANSISLSKVEKEELRIDTKILKSLDDSLNMTGDKQYYNKFMMKIDVMIKKYPNPYQKGFIQVRENMIKIFGDSLNASNHRNTSGVAIQK